MKKMNGKPYPKSAHARRKAATRARVAEAVRAIEREGRLMSISLVAEVAGVSRPTIYNHPELRSMVERAIAEQKSASKRLGSRIRSDARTIAKLKKENRKLRERLSQKP